MVFFVFEVIELEVLAVLQLQNTEVSTIRKNIFFIISILFKFLEVQKASSKLKFRNKKTPARGVLYV